MFSTLHASLLCCRITVTIVYDLCPLDLYTVYSMQYIGVLIQFSVGFAFQLETNYSPLCAHCVCRGKQKGLV